MAYTSVRLYIIPFPIVALIVIAEFLDLRSTVWGLRERPSPPPEPILTVF